MKTEPMSQQRTALDAMDGRRWYALFMEQGTGKTWSFLADAERYKARDKIDGLLVFAPNGVHTNWVLREIPAHMDLDTVLAESWRASPNAKHRRKLQELCMRSPKLRILTVNYEAMRGREARELVNQFLLSGRMMCVCDESQKIKNPAAMITKHILSLRPLTTARRIGTGTPMDKPQDIYSQFDFLAPGLLGTDNFRAFFSEYAVLANWKEPRTSSDWAMARQVEKNPRIKHAQIVARDEDTGRPLYKNLDRLQKLVAEHSYRVLKKDCLDLPEKQYTSVYFELSPAQEKAYELMEQLMRIELEDGTMTPVAALASLVKLQQITSGFVVVPDRDELMYIGEKNPRVEAVSDYIDENTEPGHKVIIWAKFREEVRALRSRLGERRSVVEYHGAIPGKDREVAIDSFQKGDAEVFIGIQKAGGTGLTLTAAELTIYCSNEHSALLRNQSEDRNHRKGTTGTVTYVDIVARGTIDEAITKAHQWKTDLAATILGDRKLDLRRFL